MIFCPNFSNKLVKREFDHLTEVTGDENITYYLWNKYEGDYALALREALALKPDTSIAEETQQDLTLKRPTKPRHLNPEQHRQMSNMLSIMKDLFPEMSVEFVDYIEGGYAGEADLNAMKILIDATKAGVDTIPHEYAHYYVDMFESSQIVQDGIAEFGSKEALVQAIGVKAAELDGKARTWWQRFKDFIRGLLKGKEYLRELIVAELTDSFLNRREIAPVSDVAGIYHQEIPSIHDVRLKLAQVANLVNFDEGKHQFTERSTGKLLDSVTQLKGKMNYDTYNAANEDQVQLRISEDARKNGTAIHAVLEDALKGKLDPKNLPKGVSKAAVEGLKSIVDNILKDYDFVASEAILADPENGVAGITDLILKDKKTGLYTIMDFKTKLVNYDNKRDANNNYINEKGKRLNGFRFSTSKRFSIKSEKDGYDFQLSTYKHMSEKYGIPIGGVAIVPIIYGTNKGFITFAQSSKVFGDNKEANEELVKKGYYSITQSQQTKFDVEYTLFHNKEIFNGDAEEVSKMTLELGKLVTLISNKLDIQQQVLNMKRKYRTQARDALQLLEEIQNMSELDAILKFVNYAAKNLSSLCKEIDTRYKQGPKARWDLSILQNYRQLATSYDIVDRVYAITSRYANMLGEDNVRAIHTACNSLQRNINQILGAFDTIGKEIYINAIKPYVSHMKHEMQEEERNKFMSANPKQSDESYEQYQARVRAHVNKWTAEHKDEIDHRTGEWLNAQASCANASFECSSISAVLDTIYNSRDPFVSSIVKMYDNAITKKEQRMITFRTRLQKALKAYRDKYGVPNVGNLREAFDDFIEATEDGISYLVNPMSAKYIEAEVEARRVIFEDTTLDFKQKQERWEEWLRKNNPIYDATAYDAELVTSINAICAEYDEAKRKLIIDNARKGINERESLSAMYKRDFITADIRQLLNDLMTHLDKRYRRPNPALYSNEKYEKMLALKDSNDPKWQLYQLFVSILNDYDSRLPHSLQLNWRLPGIIRQGAETVGTDGIRRATRNYLKKNTVFTADQNIRGTFVDENGNRIRQIPMFYYTRGAVKSDEQSYDLPTIFYKWLDAADSYLTKAELESVVNQTSVILNERKTKDGFLSKFRRQNQEMTSVKKHTASLYEDWVDLVFYGNRLTDLGTSKIPLTNTRVDRAMLMRWLINLQSQRAMQFNFVAGLNNILVGEATQAEEVLAGADTTSADYTRATKVFVQNFLGLLEDVNKTVPDNHINKLLEWFQIFETKQNQTLEGFMRLSIDDVAHAPNKIGEYEMLTRFFLAILMSKRAYDENGKDIGSMYDYLSFDGDNNLVVDPKVTNFSQSEQNNFSLKVRRLMMNMHGNYSERSAVAAQLTLWGVASLPLRKWIVPSVRRRWQAKNYDPILDREEEGMYLTFGKYLFESDGIFSVINWARTHLFHLKLLEIETMKWDQMKPYERQNVIRTAVEIGLAALAYMIFATLEPPKNDDHDFYNEALWVIKYQSYRLYTDLSFYVFPKSFTAIIKDPFPVITLLEDIGMLFYQFAFPLEEYKTGKHMFRNKLLNRAFMLTPGAKQMGRMWNTSQEINNFVHQR